MFGLCFFDVWHFSIFRFFLTFNVKKERSEKCKIPKKTGDFTEYALTKKMKATTMNVKKSVKNIQDLLSQVTNTLSVPLGDAELFNDEYGIGEQKPGPEGDIRRLELRIQARLGRLDRIDQVSFTIMRGEMKSARSKLRAQMLGLLEAIDRESEEFVTSANKESAVHESAIAEMKHEIDEIKEKFYKPVVKREPALSTEDRDNLKAIKALGLSPAELMALIQAQS